MSRSKRKIPIFPITSATSNKKDKQHASRIRRHANKGELKEMLLEDDEDFIFTEKGELVQDNPYRFSKDGKQYWPEATKKDMAK